MPLSADGTFAGGYDLADQLVRLPDTNLYAARSRVGVTRLIADAVTVKPRQLRAGSLRVRGYPVQTIIEAWGAVAPAASLDAMIPEETSPFDVESDRDDLVTVDSDGDSELLFEKDGAASDVTVDSVDSDCVGAS
jgi:hypothetical protein